MTAEIAEVAEDLRLLNLEIEKTEILMDAGLRILEDSRVEKQRLISKIERLILEEAVEYPSVIFD